MSISTIGRLYGVNGDTLSRLYKYTLSGYSQWTGMSLLERSGISYVVFPENCGPYLSIDETAFSRDEVFTIVTNKDAHGKKGALVTIIQGVRSADIIEVLVTCIPLSKRIKVKEITSDLSSAMMEASSISFPQAYLVNDRFHVQQLFNEAIDEVRIDIRHQVRREEAEMKEFCDECEQDFIPQKYNGETMPQILARTKHALMMPSNKWKPEQSQRIKILFDHFPVLKYAYERMSELRNLFNLKQSVTQAGVKLAKWYEKVLEMKRESFNTVVRTFKNNYITILNYFRSRATNASAESFNAKVKMFRAQLRGVRDTAFFIFRICKLFA